MGEIINGNSELTNSEINPIITSPMELPSSGVHETMETAQKMVEDFHLQSIDQIIKENGRFMVEDDIVRIYSGVDNIEAVEYIPQKGYTGCYLYSNGMSSIEVSVIDEQQMERSVKHETNHFASKNAEIIVPDPERNGYTVYKTVGTRETRSFHSFDTGTVTEFSSKGEGLNEGLTTMYTNRQLTELSPEKGRSAERQEIYAHATELCKQLESIVGEDTLKEAYYGGNIEALKIKVDSLAGEGGYEDLRECLDRTISDDYIERVEGMIDAQRIMEIMYENARK